jgi:hypothetical protein
VSRTTKAFKVAYVANVNLINGRLSRISASSRCDRGALEGATAAIVIVLNRSN